MPTDYEKALAEGAEPVNEGEAPAETPRYNPRSGGQAPRSAFASDADLGIETPMDFGTDLFGRKRDRPAPVVLTGPTDPLLGKTKNARPADVMERDPIAQTVAAGTATAPLAAAKVLPQAAPPVLRALQAIMARGGQGAAGAASMGGDPRLGAVLGAVGGGPAARAAMAPPPVPALANPAVVPPRFSFSAGQPTPPALPPSVGQRVLQAVEHAVKNPVSTATRVATSPMRAAGRAARTTLERTPANVTGMAVGAETQRAQAARQKEIAASIAAEMEPAVPE